MERPVNGDELDCDSVLRRLVEGLQAMVPSCLGGFLHGSSGRSRLRPQSDVDVLVVTEAPLSDGERSGLTTLLLELSGRYPRTAAGGRPIELTVVVRSEVHPWRYPPRCELQYGEWLRTEIEAGRPLEPFVAPDLAILVSMVLQCDAPIFGPTPSDLLVPVPTGDVLRATIAAVPALLDDLEHDTANVLLTLVRAWHTCVTRALVSKDEAAAWAVRQTPEEVGAVVSRALAAYLDGTVHRWDAVSDDTQHAARFFERAIRAASTPN
jgi:predicted nucleotidyltransferase